MRFTLLLVLLLAAAGGVAGRTARPAAAAAAKDCDLPGFTLRAGQLPSELPWPEDSKLEAAHAARVRLYTIRKEGKVPAPLSTLKDTHAACAATKDCVMFTSDGYMIGAFRVAGSASELASAIARAEKDGPLRWGKMDFCSGSCCGTWVAAGAEFAAPSASTPVPLQLHLGSVEPSVPSDDDISMGTMDPNTAAKVCAPQTSQWTGGCTKRCVVACCARFNRGLKHYSANYYFDQCTKLACDSCMRTEGIMAAVKMSITASGPQFMWPVYASAKPGGAAAKPAAKCARPAAAGSRDPLC